VAAVYAADGSDDRETALAQLADGELDAVCAVDVFNEGVDVPSIDRVVMLRPTESSVVFLQQLGRGLRASDGKDAVRVQVLFVTVDPKRDTQALLAQYVPAFHPDFLGLYGDEAATAKASKEFHVYAHERPGKDGAPYTVDHSAHIYVIDREGKLRLLLPPGTAPAAIASDLRLLLNS